MVQKARVGFFDIEFIAIVSNDNVRLVIEIPEIAHKHSVVLPIPLETGVVGEGSRVHLLFAIPFERKAENVPTTLKVD